MSVEESHDRFTQDSVRDLAWLMLSPALFAQPLGDFAPFDAEIKHKKALAWFARLDENPTLLGKISRRRFRRLGLYCEALFEFFFSHASTEGISPYRFIGRNIQCYSANTTLGEMDFLLQDSHSGKYVHVELATKIFLQAAKEAQEFSQWVGPNANDRLDIKLQRMVDHQLALPKKIEAQNARCDLLETLNLTQAMKSHFFIKGILFSHRDSAKCFLPERCTLSQSHGYWLRLSELAAFDGKFYCCEKMSWLAPEKPRGDSSHRDERIKQLCYDADAAVKKISDLYKSAQQKFRGNLPGIMLMHAEDDEKFSRLMVVPDYWPATSSPLRKI